MLLYHTSFSEIRSPDIHFGRANADFGQGFYLSNDEEFSRRWARERKGKQTYLNRYELATEELKIKLLSKDAEWFGYILGNRSGRRDVFSEYDVIIGPIANDTVYDTWGILTSGLVDSETALRVMMIGSTYEQIVIKSEKAVSALRFISAEVLPHETIERYRNIVKNEEEEFQAAFGKIIGNIPEITG